MDKLMELMSIIEQRDYEELSAFTLAVPEKFSYMEGGRDGGSPSSSAIAFFNRRSQSEGGCDGGSPHPQC